MMNNEELEKEMSQALTEGEMKRVDPEKAARKKLSPRYEIRVQAKLDPIVEETGRFRKIAKEVDDRYDRYLARIPVREDEDHS